MTCPECSNPVSEGVSLCTFCGAPVESTSPREKTEASQAKAAVSSFLQKIMPRGGIVREGEKPCLWNPWFIVIWYIPFLGVWVGSALIALNWQRLGKNGWALWSWGFILVDLVISAFSPGDFSIVSEIVITFVVWFVIVALPQIWFVGHYYGRSFDRRRWIVPIGLGLLIGLILGFTLPKLNEQLERWMNGSAGSTTLPMAAQDQPAVKELTVEELVEMKSGLVLPLELTWKEPYLLFFSTDKRKQGSAVFACASGRSIFMVTNRHVIEVPENAQNVSRVVIDGKNVVPFEVASKDAGGIDLALIKVMTQEELPQIIIPLAHLDQVVVGQECVAIGNTLGAGISVTTGIVSKIDEMGGYTAIRTSAPISPGNSSGALFRRKDGMLIGITTQTFDKNGAQAVNFALPVDYIDKLEPIN